MIDNFEGEVGKYNLFELCAATEERSRNVDVILFLYHERKFKCYSCSSLQKPSLPERERVNR
jgi:hypothetical protein